VVVDQLIMVLWGEPLPLRRPPPCRPMCCSWATYSSGLAGPVPARVPVTQDPESTLPKSHPFPRLSHSMCSLRSSSVKVSSAMTRKV
jgi:hypothetical protein